MKVKQISVINLFGIFNHTIPLNTEDHITIIYGLNGFGKTTLFRMINGLFNSSSYGEFLSVPFKKFIIEFEDGSQFWVSKESESLQTRDKKSGEQSTKLTFNLAKPGSEPESFSPTPPEFREIDFRLSLIEQTVPELERIASRTWQYLPTGEILSIEDVLERFGDFLPVKSLTINQPEWLKELKNSIHIRFIQTQRLSTPPLSRQPSRNKRSVSAGSAIVKYSEELATAIESKLAEYGSLSQSLDRSFPARLISQSVLSDLALDALRQKLIELEQKRTRFIAAGLLDQEKDIDFQIPQEIDSTKISVLSVYVKDVEQKLSVFDEMAAKIELFKKTINDRFLYKQMGISRDEGFTFTTLDGNPLSPTNLSSGEQQELVLLYELLFKVTSNSIILIDEPEISLHIAWQEEFLRDLQQMTKLSNFDVMIATHSPQIISDRWDLTVELRKPSI